MDLMITYSLTILALIITMSAQGFINTTYSKYKKVKTNRGITGAEVAKKILDKNNIFDVEVVETSGNLTDHYDPTKKVVRLSSDIYHGSSIASASVAAHECGHVIQHDTKYLFLTIRSMIVPIVNLASYAGYFSIMLGFLFSILNLVWLGIFAELVILLFQVITLPVEFNASKRGLKQLTELNIVDEKEIKGCRKMLVAAALTYVASVLATVLEILRLILIVAGRNRD